MSGLDLREEFEELAERIPPPPAASIEDLRARRQRRTRVRWIAVAAVVSSVLGVLAGLVALTRVSAAPTVVDAPATDVVPPEGMVPPVTMLVSPSPVPASGGLIALAVVNRSDRAFEYGLGGDLQRWDGQAWQPFRRFTSTQTASHASGELIGADEPLVVDGIALVAPPQGVGLLEWITLPELEPGWYRFVRNDGDILASAAVQVTADAAAPELTAPGSGPVIDVQPPVLEPQAAEVRFVVSAPGTNSIEQANELAASMAVTAVLDKWEGDRWEPQTELTVDMQPPGERGHVHEWAVQLPDLDAGTYRLVQDSTTGEPAVGHFWISDLLSEDDTGTAAVPQEEPSGDLVLTDLVGTPWPPFNGTYEVTRLDHQTGNMQLVRRATIDFLSMNDWELRTDDGQREWFRDGRYCTSVPGPDGNTPDCRIHSRPVAPSDWLQQAWPSMIPGETDGQQWAVRKDGDEYAARMLLQQPCGQVLPPDSCADPNEVVDRELVVRFGAAGIPHLWSERNDGTVTHHVQFTQLTVAGQRVR